MFQLMEQLQVNRVKGNHMNNKVPMFASKLFYKTFKMKFNCTPKEVRKTMKKDDFK